jgi:hypothetical protein
MNEAKSRRVPAHYENQTAEEAVPKVRELIAKRQRLLRRGDFETIPDFPLWLFGCWVGQADHFAV